MTAQPLGLAGPALSHAGWHWLAPAVAMAAAASGARQRTPRLAATDWTCFPRLAVRTPGQDTRSVGTARDFCLSTMRRWGVTDRGDDVAVVVSELLTNALRHAVPHTRLADGSQGATGRHRWPVRLGLVQPGQFVLCAVADPSPRPPEPKDPDYLAESGRGLHVISALSDRWGWTVPAESGKVVWALFSARLDRQPPDWGWSPRGGRARSAA
ncbi:MAG: regulatory protein [Actinomycetia bacterium]|nr:regulatory protein [Actinomycetes bacterium]